MEIVRGVYDAFARRDNAAPFAAYALDQSKPLAMGERRQGMLFFILPDRAIQATGLKLIGVLLDASDTVELELD